MTRPCIGCLGTRTCWICEGSGDAKGPATGSATRSECRRCSGTGVCSMCAEDMPVQRPALWGAGVPSTGGH